MAVEYPHLPLTLVTETGILQVRQSVPEVRPRFLRSSPVLELESETGARLHKFGFWSLANRDHCLGDACPYRGVSRRIGRREQVEEPGTELGRLDRGSHRLQSRGMMDVRYRRQDLGSKGGWASSTWEGRFQMVVVQRTSPDAWCCGLEAVEGSSPATSSMSVIQTDVLKTNRSAASVPV